MCQESAINLGNYNVLECLVAPREGWIIIRASTIPHPRLCSHTQTCGYQCFRMGFLGQRYKQDCVSMHSARTFLPNSALVLVRFGGLASAPRTAAEINKLMSPDPQPLCALNNITNNKNICHYIYSIHYNKLQ